MAFASKQREAEYKSEWQKENRPKNNAAKRRWKASLSPEDYEEYKAKERAGYRRRRQEQPVTTRLNSIRARAKRKGVKFDLTAKWFKERAGVCSMTGIALNFEKDSPWLAEVDRINAGGDYTMDNCRVVCAIYNRAKMNYTDADVLKLAKALT